MSNKKSVSRPIGLFLKCAAPLALMASAAVTHGTVIISDTFTGADGTAIPGRSADTVDVPATTYAANGGSAFTNSILGNRAQLGVDEGDGIGTGISAPTVYTISDLFNNGNIGGSDQNDRGEGLGFFTSLASGTNGFHGDGTFTGITVSPAGLLSLISVTPSQAITVYSTATVAGYSATVDHTLSYSANTTTGLVSNVLLDGSPISLTPLISSAGLFTPADTAFAGFTASANALGESATYDNFAVAVPEPTSVGILAFGAAAILRRRRPAVNR
jgi:hypothetical protein